MEIRIENILCESMCIGQTVGLKRVSIDLTLQFFQIDYYDIEIQNTTKSLSIKKWESCKWNKNVKERVLNQLSLLIALIIALNQHFREYFSNILIGNIELSTEIYGDSVVSSKEWMRKQIKCLFIQLSLRLLYLRIMIILSMNIFTYNIQSWLNRKWLLPNETPKIKSCRAGWHPNG